jgi:hypothetical protein
MVVRADSSSRILFTFIIELGKISPGGKFQIKLTCVQIHAPHIACPHPASPAKGVNSCCKEPVSI